MVSTARIEVFYDGGCPICVWEVKLYRHMDKAALIRWTAIETLLPSDLPTGKTQDELLGRFHVRDLTLDMSGSETWYIGVDAFARIWRVLPGLKYFAGLFSLPGIRQLTMLAYKGFLKWQSWHRKRRKVS